ncbi:daunorubicin/doxorubicin resistance ABC transporter ATP-binding protein DrrA [Saccharomonospora sp. CUA-673]|uniref:ATP-binding cassette domain-containing protein n=1 Tax=Saccharomonospora sp. CUA-673 TaxID=1904969 RepID=UPI000961D7F7|nr:ATP-binding cassette domain-containing protein [Saccharomonospora sp. CUA-673]OLT40068.1 daunorubicin/doxorubicin resistance ABC transporter ATP-binding protein DrrA [Saccharomonospora sp. CUA-673]
MPEVDNVATTAAVRVRGLVKTFGEHRAVDGVDLDVPIGSVHALLGPNGAGKTTTVRLLATLLRPDDGEASVFGLDIATEAAAVRRRIGLTGQYASVDDALTATENLVIFGRLLGLPRRRARTRAAELLAEFDLAEAANRPVTGFSGGMRRRLDLAASLIARPPLLFLDEPTTGLDPRTRNALWETTRRLVADGTTVVLTTQYLEEADQLADRVTVLDHGAVVASGTPDSLKDSLGRSSLRVRLLHGTDLDVARETLTSVFGPGMETDVDGLGLSIPVADPSVVADAAIALRGRGIGLSEIAVVRPSLDDVFLTLTGNPDTEPAVV